MTIIIHTEDHLYAIRGSAFPPVYKMKKRILHRVTGEIKQGEMLFAVSGTAKHLIFIRLLIF